MGARCRMGKGIQRMAKTKHTHQMKKTTQLKIHNDKAPYLQKYVPTIQLNYIVESSNSDMSEVQFEYDTRDFELILLQVFFAGIMYKSENK